MKTEFHCDCVWLCSVMGLWGDLIDLETVLYGNKCHLAFFLLLLNSSGLCSSSYEDKIVGALYPYVCDGSSFIQVKFPPWRTVKYISIKNIWTVSSFKSNNVGKSCAAYVLKSEIWCLLSFFHTFGTLGKSITVLSLDVQQTNLKQNIVFFMPLHWRQPQLEKWSFIFINVVLTWCKFLDQVVFTWITFC